MVFEIATMAVLFLKPLTKSDGYLLKQLVELRELEEKADKYEKSFDPYEELIVANRCLVLCHKINIYGVVVKKEDLAEYDRLNKIVASNRFRAPAKTEREKRMDNLMVKATIVWDRAETLRTKSNTQALTQIETDNLIGLEREYKTITLQMFKLLPPREPQK